MVNYEKRGHIGLLTIDRPEARNAVNGDVAQGMEAAIDELEADDEVWVGILMGNGPVFCAGADLKAISAGRVGDLQTERGGFGGIVVRERTKPDHRRRRRSRPGRRDRDRAGLRPGRGLHPGPLRHPRGQAQPGRRRPAGCSGCPRKIPFNVAMELALTGDPISAERAYHFGLVNRLVEPGTVLEAAIELAEQICANAPLAVRESRRLVLESITVTDDREGVRQSGAAMMGLASTEDFAEGPLAFIEKRPPVWKGR